MSGAWSPLSAFIAPGMRVVIKPNLVTYRPSVDDETQWSTVTDAAVIRVVADYVALALRGRGTIVVADSPLRMTSFSDVVGWSGLDRVLDDVSATWGVGVELVDLRDQVVADPATFDHTLRVTRQQGDPLGTVEVDLGKASMLDELGRAMTRLRSTAALGRNETRHQHAAGRHVYGLSRTVLDADFIVSVPKLKTHKKAGLTGAMKNYVGAVIRKEWLPHHRKGAPASGGDEHADDVSVRLKLRERFKDLHRQTPLGRVLLTPGKWVYRQLLQDGRLDPLSVPTEGPTTNGGWSGNDTCWRMVHDIFRAVLYARSDGSLDASPVRSQLTILDGLIAGEGDGPLRTTPRRAGMLLIGSDAVWVDYYAALLMGYRPEAIPLVQRALDHDGLRPLTALRRGELDVRCTPADVAERLRRAEPLPDRFLPPLGWARHLADEATYSIALQLQAAGSLDY